MNRESTSKIIGKQLNNYEAAVFQDELIFTINCLHKIIMAAKLILYISVFFLTCCSVSKNPLRKEVKQLQIGIIKDDTSYVYALPYQVGKTFRVIQGYFSRFTHKERAALDFNMKRGTKITAARDGIVVRAKEDGKKGKLKSKYRPDGNNIVIQHADGSSAGYWHLQHNGALVNVGDTVIASEKADIKPGNNCTQRKNRVCTGATSAFFGLAFRWRAMAADSNKISNNKRHKIFKELGKIQKAKFCTTSIREANNQAMN